MSTMTEYEMAALSVLNRIASALETIAMSNAKAPNIQRPIESYANFDFDSIGAQVKAADQFGATALDWGGFIWTRRSPQNKFGEAIWFSRAIGKREDGSNEYARLISFKKFGEAEPLPRKVEAIVEKSAKPVAQPAAEVVESPASFTTPAPSDADESELDKYFGPKLSAAQPELPSGAIPKTEAEFNAWLKSQGFNGQETRAALGTDARAWLKDHAGLTWADVARQIVAHKAKK
jgi:hypothetical protein